MIITFNLVPHPTCISQFLNRFVSPPPTFPISSSFHCITSTLHLSPTYFPSMERRPPGHTPPPPPAILRRSICAPHRVPVSAVVSHIVRPRCCRPQPAPRSLSDPGGSPTAVPPTSLCTASLPVCCSDPLNLLGLDFSGAGSSSGNIDRKGWPGVGVGYVQVDGVPCQESRLGTGLK